MVTPGNPKPFTAHTDTDYPLRGRDGRQLFASPTNAANVPDVSEVAPAVDAIPAAKEKPGRARKGPDELFGDRPRQSEPHREKLRRMGDRYGVRAAGTAVADPAPERLGITS
jgi:hypothetical protein